MFDESGTMRKTKKASLYDAYSPMDLPTVQQVHYVIDGGHLMHRVVWTRGQTYEDVCLTIVEYVKRHYGNQVTVIFDGYEENTLTTCTKTAERMRRSGVKSADVLFEASMPVLTSQSDFLSSNKNKSRLIKLLSKHLRQSGFEVIECDADADTQIVTKALTLSATASKEQVVIIGDDVDLLVLLTALASEDQSNVYIKKPAKGKIPENTYNAGCLKYESIKKLILLLHAFSGCDTTSALYNFGKKKFVDILKKNKSLRDVLLVFYEKNADEEALKLAGEKFFLALYGGDLEDDLDELRYVKFAKSTTKNKANLASIPPSKASAFQHTLRVYHQTQMWLNNHLDPTKFGWKIQNNCLRPVTTTKQPAPEQVMKILFCSCKKNCGAHCGCRKSGLKCSDVCGNCKGQSCTNSKPVLNESDDEDNQDSLE